MQFSLDKEQLPVACTYCDWEGKLCQTEDQDVLETAKENWQAMTSSCICPRCGHEVQELQEQLMA